MPLFPHMPLFQHYSVANKFSYYVREKIFLTYASVKSCDLQLHTLWNVFEMQALGLTESLQVRADADAERSAQEEAGAEAQPAAEEP